MAAPEESVAPLAASIRGEFGLFTKESHLMGNSWAELRMSDFGLWMAGVGATASKSASLDTRLQSLPDQLIVLKNMLSSLKKSLVACRDSSGEEMGESEEIVDLIIENLAMLATVIRRTGKSSRRKRGDQTFDSKIQSRLRLHFDCIILLRLSATDCTLFRPADPRGGTKWFPTCSQGTVI